MTLRFALLAALLAAVPASAQVDYRLTATPEQTQAEPGEAFNIDWRLRNEGSADGPDTEIRFYLSEDATVSGDDALLSVEEVDGVEAGEEEDGTEGVNAPDWAPGYYYLLVAEGDDGEVVVFSFVLGTPPPSADLAVESVTTDDADGVVEVGQTVTVSAVVRNDGDGSSPTTTVGLYLSDDDEVSTDDERVGETTLGSLAVGASATAEVSFVVPNDVDDQFTVLARADDLGEVNEPSETNNVGALSLATPAADVVLFTGLYVERFDSMGTAAHAPLPTGWTASGSGIADGTKTTTDRGGNGYDFGQEGLVNFGSGPAATAGDRALGFDFARGEATLVFRNDTGGPVSQIEVGYTWEIYGAGYEENFYTGTDASYSYDGESWTSLDLFQFVSTGDCCLGGYFDAPDRFAVNKAAVLDLFTPIGAGERFYLRFEETGYAEEGDEPGSPSAPVLGLDNVFVSTTPGVPLVYRDHAERELPGVPVGGDGTAVAIGARFPVREGEPRPDVQAVLGGAHPDDFTVELADPPDGWDGLTLFEVYMTPTAAGDRQATLTFVVDGAESRPVALSGTAEAGPPGFPTGPGPDYLFTEIDPDDTPFPDGQGAVGVDYRVSNYGEAGEDTRTYMGLYLSTDDTLSDDDLPLSPYDEQVMGMNSLGERTGSVGGFLPLDAAPGDYRLIALVDDLGLIDENLETNNTASIPVTVTDDGGPTDPTGDGTGSKADLRVSRVEIDGDVNAAPPFPSVVAGGTISLRVLVGNVGGVDAPATDLRIGISSFPIAGLCSGEVLRVPVDALPVESYAFVDVDLDIAPTRETGRYVLCAEIDPDGALNETSGGGIARAAFDVESSDQPPLAGTYAVPGDYASLEDAAAALTTWGVDGPVRIELAAGTYDDRVSLGAVAGASATNRVVITSASGNPADVVLAPPAAEVSGANYIIEIAEAGYVTVSDLTLRIEGAEYQTALRVEGGPGVEVRGNVFEGAGPGGEGGGTAQGTVNVLAGDVVVAANTFTDAPFAVSVGTPFAVAPDVEVRDNVITGAHSRGVTLSNAPGVIVAGNRIEAGDCGICASGLGEGGLLDRNVVVADGAGIEVSSSELADGAEGTLSNNAVVVTGPGAGLRLAYADGWQVLHNSVVASDGPAFEMGDGPNLRVFNNVFAVTGTGRAYDASYDYAPFESGHNALWAPNGTLGRVGPDTFSDLAAFVAALDGSDPDGTEGSGAIEADPAFADPASGDLHTTAAALQGAGLDVGVGTDLDGESRPQPAGSAPDIGADETGDGGPASGPISIVIDGRRGSRFLGVPSPGVTVDDLAAQNLVRGVPGYYPAATPPNLWTRYDAEAASWVVSAGTGEVLQPGHGFRWFFYDRDVGNPDVSRSRSFPATLSTDRPANTADVEIELQTGGSRFNYLANPFGEPLDLSGLFSWPGGDNLAVPYGVEVYDDQARTWEPAPAVLQPWEGFRVRAKGPRVIDRPRLLTIPASAVAPTAARSAAPRSSEQRTEADAAEVARLTFSLEGVDADGQPLADRSLAVVFAADASPAFDAADAPREAVGSEAAAVLAARVGGAVVSRDVRPFAPGEVAIAVGARGAASSFTLSWDASALPDGLPVVLIDRLTGAEADVRTRSEWAIAVPERPALSEAEAVRGAEVGIDDRFVLRVGAGSVEAPVAELALAAPAPNPTSGSAQVAFAVPEAGHVRLAAYDVRGRRVAVLEDRELAAGRHEATLDGSALAAGVYVIRLEAGGEVVTRRAAVVR
jgi:hypothetical protein